MEQRSQPRIEVDGPVKVSLVGSVQDPLQGRLSNVSDDGFMATLPQAFKAGDVVQVDGGEDLIVAEVRHCRKADGGYVVGFEIRDWSNKGSLRALLRSFESVATAS